MELILTPQIRGALTPTLLEEVAADYQPLAGTLISILDLHYYRSHIGFSLRLR